MMALEPDPNDPYGYNNPYFNPYPYQSQPIQPTTPPYSNNTAAVQPGPSASTPTQSSSNSSAPWANGWQNWNTEERWTNLLKNVGQVTNPSLNAYSYGGGTENLVNQYNQIYGGNARFLGGPSGDMVDFGDGRGPVDIKLANGSYWFGSPFSPGPAVPSGGGAAGASSGGIGGSLDPMVKALYDQLLARSNQSLNINPRTDQNIRTQADAFAAAQERAKRDYLSQVAESRSPLANLTGETRLANERYGQATSGFEAQLVGQELAARRGEIQNALTQMGDLLTTEQKLSLQMQLAQMDDAIKRLGLSQSYDVSLQNLGLQRDQQANSWDALRSGLLG